MLEDRDGSATYESVKRRANNLDNDELDGAKQDLDMLVHVENVRPFEMTKNPNWKRRIRGNVKNGPVLEVKVTNYLERFGIAVEIDSMQNDGTQSWIVISRGIIKYVTELLEENKKPIHFEEVATSAGQLVAMKQKDQSSSSSSSTMPIKQRKWNDISAVGNIDDKSYKISKKMTRLQRHQGYLRDDNGAIEWRQMLRMFCREHLDAP